MKKAKIKSVILSEFATNCYVICNKETNESLIIDPASNAEIIQRLVTSTGCEPKAILLTHGHYDHIGAAETLSAKYNIKIYCHNDEEDVLKSPQINLSSMLGENCVVKPDVLLNDKEKINLAGFDIEVLHTPGHTKGSCCYLFEAEEILVSGDTLFYGSYGRTDFPTGSTSSLMHSIKDRVLTLNPDIEVYSGHGSSTTIGDERKWY